MAPFRPHDLLRLSTQPRLLPDAPRWVVNALNSTPWVVVRRASSPTGGIAVGVRGPTRSQRYAFAVGPDDVSELVAPEDLAHLPPLPSRKIAALSTLETVHSLLDGSGLAWGPTGSVGFELATGVPTATPDSDLDILIRVPRGAPDVHSRLIALHQKLSLARVRVDCQIETPTGAVALAELIGEQADVMLRTVDGPRLVPRPTAVP